MEFDRRNTQLNLHLPSGFALVGPAAIYRDDLLNAIAGDPVSWADTFVTNRREECVAVLTNLLVRPDQVALYVSSIQVAAVSQGENLRGMLDPFPIEEVTRHGVGILSDRQLAALSLDPIELSVLSEYLDELLDTADCGSVWYDARLIADGIFADPTP